MKPKKCAQCGASYEPRQLGQKACSIDCAIAFQKAHPEIRDRTTRLLDCLHKRARSRQRREKLEGLMTRSDWLKRAQKAFNAYIRERDKHDPCISCNRCHQGQYHAGHYRTVKSAPELRFSEDNVHKQCAPCNDHLSGNVVNYRIHLIERIGLDRVEQIEGPHEPLKLTIPQIQEIERTYKAKLKALQDS